MGLNKNSSYDFEEYINENLQQILLSEQLQEKEELPQVTDSPETEKLKRDIQREALARLETAARTVDDFKDVTHWWDRLDANRERRERYHEVNRSGFDIPMDYGARPDGLCFPDYLNGVLFKQMCKGDFIDLIFNCPYEIRELVTEEYLSKILNSLSDAHKEILYFNIVRSLSTKQIGDMRGQTDRNIRKVRATVFRKIHKKMLPILERRMNNNKPMTKEERQFVLEMKKAATANDRDG